MRLSRWLVDFVSASAAQERDLAGVSFASAS